MQHRSKAEFTGWFLTKRNRFKLWPKFEALFEFFLYYCSMLFFKYISKSNFSFYLLT